MEAQLKSKSSSSEQDLDSYLLGDFDDSDAENNDAFDGGDDDEDDDFDKIENSVSINFVLLLNLEFVFIIKIGLCYMFLYVLFAGD